MKNLVNKYAYFKRLKYFFVLIGIYALGVLIPYIVKFGFGFSANHTIWAEFSTYWNGFLGTILTFLNFSALIYTIELQKENLRFFFESTQENQRLARLEQTDSQKAQLAAALNHTVITIDNQIQNYLAIALFENETMDQNILMYGCAKRVGDAEIKRERTFKSLLVALRALDEALKSIQKDPDFKILVNFFRRKYQPYIERIREVNWVIEWPEV